MAIISFDKNEVISYTPVFMDNDKSEDPTVVNLKYVGYGKLQKYSQMITTKTVARSKGKDSAEQRGIMLEVTKEVQEKQFTECVDSVENYFIRKKGEEVAVKDAKTFYETAPPDLINEIILTMEDFNKLSGEQRKN